MVQFPQGRVKFSLIYGFSSSVYYDPNKKNNDKRNQLLWKFLILAVERRMSGNYYAPLLPLIPLMNLSLTLLGKVHIIKKKIWKKTKHQKRADKLGGRAPSCNKRCTWWQATTKDITQTPDCIPSLRKLTAVLALTNLQQPRSLGIKSMVLSSGTNPMLASWNPDAIKKPSSW